MCADVHDAVCNFPGNEDACRRDELDKCQRLTGFNAPPEASTNLVALPELAPTNLAPITIDLQQNDACAQPPVATPNDFTRVLRCSQAMVLARREQMKHDSAAMKSYSLGPLAVVFGSVVWLGWSMYEEDMEDTKYDYRHHPYYRHHPEEQACRYKMRICALILLTISATTAGLLLGSIWLADVNRIMMSDVYHWLDTDVMGDLYDLFGPYSQLQVENVSMAPFRNLVMDLSTLLGKAVHESWKAPWGFRSYLQ